MHVTLELDKKYWFPEHSQLKSYVDINIEQPPLLSHQRKIHTRLVTPAELRYTDEDPLLQNGIMRLQARSQLSINTGRNAVDHGTG
jgi:hypothetical protein